MGDTLFGTDGIRGVANADLTPQFVFDIAHAAGEAITGHVLIGRDTRRSGAMLLGALVPASRLSVSTPSTSASYRRAASPASPVTRTP